MLEVVRELVDAVAGLHGISGNRQAELHSQLNLFDQAAEQPKAKVKADPDVPAGA